ncbi:MAG: C4-dicarboxylate ABC transporter substrate-binding protein, partial [Roseovarius sp.]|nr:C4-dicarboxylate ABC transporter substrate-binding protein [Roseovarius sp.]
LNPGTVNCPVVVNIDAYEALSDAEREALDGSVGEAIDYYLANYGELLKKWDTILEEKNVTKVTISDEQLAEFKKVAADPIAAAWIEEMSAQGMPAQELFDLVGATLEKTRASN